MVQVDRGVTIACGLLMLAMAGPAVAQENLDLGKTPAQLYAADCAICHKSPNGLTKGGGLFGLSGFLREHYTASKESAAAIAAYLESIDKGPPAAAKRSPTRSAKGDSKGKPGKPGDAKPASAAPGEAKPGEPKTGETKPTEAKPADTKSAKPKSSDSKSDAKPDSKSDTKSDAKPDSKPESKSDTKSDEKKPD